MMHTQFRAWLGAVPTANAFERQQAMTLQIVLLLYGGMVALLLPPIAGSLSGQFAWVILLGVYFLIFTLIISTVVVLRRGRFQTAVHLAILSLIGTVAITFIPRGSIVSHALFLAFSFPVVFAGVFGGHRTLLLTTLGMTGLVVVATSLESWGSPLVGFVPFQGNTIAATLATVCPMLGLLALLLDRYRRTYQAALADARTRGQELELANMRLRFLLDQLPAIVWTTDRDFVITSIGGMGLSKMDFQPDQVIGTSAYEYFQSTNPVIVALHEALAGQSATYEEVAYGRTFHAYVEPLRDEQGQIVGTIGISLDITEQRQLQLQVQQAQKMESIGHLAGGIAHDFNNLLTAIHGYIDLALQQLPAEHPSNANLAEIRKAVDRATALTRQLLTFARKQVIAPRVRNLNDLILGLDPLLRRLIGVDIELVIVPAMDLWPAKVDENQIEQLLVNLVVNARDAMPAGGALTITTANVVVEEVEARRHRGVPPGSYVMVAVRDTGIGMLPEVQTHIFEPFFTTKEVGKGTGLGLAVCDGIVAQHGGYITVTSEVGQGTKMQVYLPRVEGTVEACSQDTRSQEWPLGRETVLLVEDEVAVRTMAMRILQRQGYTVLEATNGLEALRIANHYGRRIDLLLTDMVMPGLGGMGLAEQLCATRPELKVLLMSGYSGDWPGDQVGRIAFLQKPFTADQLAYTVREVLDDGQSTRAVGQG